MQNDPDRFPDQASKHISFDEIPYILKDNALNAHKYTISKEEAGRVTVNFTPQSSDWECVVISNGQWSTTFRPVKGSEPNWFHRKMQELCFGVKWRKVK